MSCTIETARLALRPPAAEDVPAMAEAIGNYDVARWLGRVPYPYGPGDAERFIAEARPGQTWVMTENGTLVGGISADHELGFWLARPAWGRGLATEACDAVVDHWFADPAKATLPSGHFADNDRSARVLIKQGFVYAGQRNMPSRALSQDVASRAMELSRETWAARRRYRLNTPRLTLRELQTGDLDDLRRIAGHPAVARMLFNVPVPFPLPQARHWLNRWRFRGRLGFRAAVCRRGRFIGSVGIGRIPGTATVTCMYFIDPACQGRGFAREALVHFLHDTMVRFHVASVWADHFDDNPASGAVLRHAGFAVLRPGTGSSLARGAGEYPTTVYRLDRAALPAL